MGCVWGLEFLWCVCDLKIKAQGLAAFVHKMINAAHNEDNFTDLSSECFGCFTEYIRRNLGYQMTVLSYQP